MADRSVSITTEREFLAALDEIAANLGQSRAALVRSIGENHHMANLSAAIRIFVI
ncbi:ribbon-helix-helix domain-containing protein, partial [Tardiphaga sp. 538_B7_N1_4]